MPLRAYCELDAFKVYFLDIGLLSCMSGLTSNILTTNDDIFVEFKGILTEQFVLQEIKSAIDYFGYYYTNKTSTSEIDFLINNSDGIIPIEVKAGINLKAKSLKTKQKMGNNFNSRSNLNKWKSSHPMKHKTGKKKR